jgi:diguanylate cyclase (GGDEF)-like protein
LVLLNQGLLAEGLDRWQDALALAAAAKDAAAACLASNIVGRATALRSRVLVKQGRAGEATDAASEALSIGITADHNEVKSVAMLALADASEATGDYEGAARALRRALELTRVQREVPRDLLVQMRDALSDEARARSELSHRRSEVTELREAAAELARRTEALIEAGHRDKVTGLASRARADEWLPQLMDAAKFAHQAMAVALIDIDHLKAINDGFGPTVGDRVLQRVADLTRGQLRESDFAARYGSDEIVLFLPRVGGRDPARQVAERVVAAVGRTDWRELSAELKVAVNVGVALLVSQDSPESLRARAEQALIASRKAGVNKVEFAAAPDL